MAVGAGLVDVDHAGGLAVPSGDLAHHRIGHDVEVAGGQRRRQEHRRRLEVGLDLQPRPQGVAQKQAVRVFIVAARSPAPADCRDGAFRGRAGVRPRGQYRAMDRDDRNAELRLLLREELADRAVSAAAGGRPSGIRRILQTLLVPYTPMSISTLS